MKFKILQLKHEEKIIQKYGFMDYDYASRHGFSLNDYEVTYEDQMPYNPKSEFESMDSWLNSIFVMFNMDRPEDFNGHSMSVSDIIQTEDGRMFYVEPIGWREIR